MDSIERETKLAEFIRAQGIEYGATFVPKSKSRNKDEKSATLNWRVTISTKTGAIVTDYMQGIAHVPRYHEDWTQRRTLDTEEREELAAERGRYSIGKGPASGITSRPIPAPKLEDVLYSLVLDSSVIDASGFEDWASDLGYDTDSRKAEALYRKCLQQALMMRRMIGDTGLTILRELFQDY